jgi:hypothetical protein
MSRPRGLHAVSGALTYHWALRSAVQQSVGFLTRKARSEPDLRELSIDLTSFIGHTIFDN